MNIRARLQKLEKITPETGEVARLSDDELSALLAACRDHPNALSVFPISAGRFSRILTELRHGPV